MNKEKKTVRVIMKTTVAGPHLTCQAGKEANIDPALAQRFKNGGHCEYVNPNDDPDIQKVRAEKETAEMKKRVAKEKKEKGTEKATIKKPETATTQ